MMWALLGMGTAALAALGRRPAGSAEACPLRTELDDEEAVPSGSLLACHEPCVANTL